MVFTARLKETTKIPKRCQALSLVPLVPNIDSTGIKESHRETVGVVKTAGGSFGPEDLQGRVGGAGKWPSGISGVRSARWRAAGPAAPEGMGHPYRCSRTVVKVSSSAYQERQRNLLPGNRVA
jgi:hypothetical protein